MLDILSHFWREGYLSRQCKLIRTTSRNGIPKQKHSLFYHRHHISEKAINLPPLAISSIGAQRGAITESPQ